MEQGKLREIFKKTNYQPETDLSEIIWFSMIRHEKSVTRVKLGLFSVLGILSFIGIMPALNILLLDFSQSGFYEYFSLLFSSKGALVSSWKELAYSLAESLPTFNILLLMSILFIFFLSVRYILKQIIKNNYIGRAYLKI